MKPFILISFLLMTISLYISAQTEKYWHGKERELRYTPDGEDFVIVNGDKKFNRALYGTNSAFRIETGDLPEFGFFMPNMGGNMQLGLIRGDKSLWLNDTDYIKSIYRAGSRIYEIKDPLLEEGKIMLTVLAMAGTEGMIMKIETVDIPTDIKLISVYGGASNKRFSRNGDLGVDDPNAFSLRPDACSGNIYTIDKNTFSLEYGQGSKDGAIIIDGIFPEMASLKKATPYTMSSPLELKKSTVTDNKPVLISEIDLGKSGEYFVAIKKRDKNKLSYDKLKPCFDKTEAQRKEIAGAVKINTPDPYFNTLGGVLSVAADGIWDDATNCWQHGAIGWRMPLNGWRAAYVGDAIGWHKRARIHFDGYAASQITDVESTIPHPAQDESLNLARADKKWGTQMYSNGYICRNPNKTGQMHHYDMNLVYIDELLWHFNWTGDIDYIKRMWPVLQRHLAWEKRNFDPNNDGLYDAYAGIWASDALQYNSGGVTHSSAYNYRANKMAAEIAAKIGEDPKPYEDEAEKILKAINSTLWMSQNGWWAEYRDFMGNKMIHPDAAVWTVYHAIDSDIHTPFQAYQATRYIDTQIPHIPVLAKGLKDEGYQTIATTNWLPYSWSINNVAFAEVAHTSLAYWEAGRTDAAYKLFKSSILDGMYLGSSPGNIGQVSFYDAARGECYRDFADPIGVYSRVLIQGLFGILPDAMNNKLVLRPGFPAEWNHASISTSDIDFSFKRNDNTDTYYIKSRFEKELDIELLVKADKENIKSLTVNGKETEWRFVENVGCPLIKVVCPASAAHDIVIEWSGFSLQGFEYQKRGVNGEKWTLKTPLDIQKIYDPQSVLSAKKIDRNTCSGLLSGITGYRTLFVQVKQGQMIWWEPVHIEIVEPFSIENDAEADKLKFKVKNNCQTLVNIELVLNKGDEEFSQMLTLGQGVSSDWIIVPQEKVKFGTNTLQIKDGDKIVFDTKLINWNLKKLKAGYEPLNIDRYLNASVHQIFKNKYLTPRSPYTTLQVPIQGIGEWCHPTLTAEIDDSGLRKSVQNNIITTPFGIPFRTAAEKSTNNIAFTTLWDNYPTEINIPLSGKASHAYLMMAGSTNHMQCHVVNGTVSVRYKDGSKAVLELIPPVTWVPIEQDYYIDGQAFRLERPRPYRVAFKTGIISRNMEKDMNIKPDEVYGRSIDGGAGIILDIPLDKSKELDSIELKSIANEVVIGLMGITLLR